MTEDNSLCVFTRVHVCAYTHVCVCMCVCAYTLRVYMCVCMCLCLEPGGVGTCLPSILPYSPEMGSHIN